MLPNIITQGRLKSLLDYDKNTGVFTWKEDRGGWRGKKGQIAGCHNAFDYIEIRLDHKLYKAHRLAWLYVYGSWPQRGLDHRNRIKSDNRIDNLREASQSQNLANSKARHQGLKGAFRTQRSKEWLAQIKKNGRAIHLDYFVTEPEAHAAYMVAAQKLHGEFARSK